LKLGVKMESVIVFMAVRNEEQYLVKTLDSILEQDYPLKKIILVNDGSSDSTPEIIAEYQKNNLIIETITRKDRGFSAMGTLFLVDPWNEGLKLLLKEDFDYLLLCDGDSFYPSDYLSSLISELNKNEKIGVASGYDDLEKGKTSDPRNTGCLIKGEIVREMEQYPRIYTPDTFILLVARFLGYQTQTFTSIPIFLQRPTGIGSKNYFIAIGKGMNNLGYHPLYALGRVLSNMINRKVQKGLYMLYGYLVAPEVIGIEKYRKFQRRSQKEKIVRIVRSIIRKFGI